MAIVITKQPVIKPLSAYNNSIFEFELNSGIADRASIVVGSNTFLIYPDANGVFRFNFKEVAKSLINQDGFKDNLNPNSSNFILNDDNLFLEISALIEVTQTNGNTQQEYLNLKFIKSVDQIINVNSANSDFKLLNINSSYENDLTYFEGYPFDFSFYQIDNDGLYFRNYNNMPRGQLLKTTSKGVNRIFFPESENSLNIESGINRVIFEMSGNGFFTNINKVPYRCGTYLKWFNPFGGWSYYLFDELNQKQLRTKTIDTVSKDFENINQTNTNISITGKEAVVKRSVRAENINKNDRDLIDTIFVSPKVMLYNEGNFYEVEVDKATISRTNKYNQSNIDFDILMPNIITQTL